MSLRFLSRFTPLDKSMPQGKLHYLAGFIINLLSFYQRYISRSLPLSCRFYPSCSEYAKQAILKYGLSRGIIIALVRLVNCHPFSGKQGFDPLR